MLCYCTNVHPSETLEQVRAALTQGAARVRSALGQDELATGLYLSASVVERLQGEPQAVRDLVEVLREQSLQVSTLNGFPYGDFHAQRVKEKVYLPDWSDPKRSNYTVALAHLLCELMGEERYGSISSVALGLRTTFESPELRRKALIELGKVALALAKIEAERGIRIVLSLEPEPFTALESTQDVLDFFTQELWREGAALLSNQPGLQGELSGDQTRARELLQRYIGICYDCCHQAVEFESARESLSAITSAGVVIGKVQLSNALLVPAPAARSLLAPFAEERYLHQSFLRLSKGVSMDELRHRLPRAIAQNVRFHAATALQPALISAIDLPECFCVLDHLASEGFLAKVDDVRTHFHVPLFWEEAAGATGQNSDLSSTQAFLREVLECHKESALSPHLEIETYTWNVLPESMRADELAQGIAHEFDWVQDRLSPKKRHRDDRIL